MAGVSAESRNDVAYPGTTAISLNAGGPSELRSTLYESSFPGGSSQLNTISYADTAVATRFSGGDGTGAAAAGAVSPSTRAVVTREPALARQRRASAGVNTRNDFISPPSRTVQRPSPAYRLACWTKRTVLPVRDGGSGARVHPVWWPCWLCGRDGAEGGCKSVTASSHSQPVFPYSGGEAEEVEAPDR